MISLDTTSSWVKQQLSTPLSYAKQQPEAVAFACTYLAATLSCCIKTGLEHEVAIKLGVASASTIGFIAAKCLRKIAAWKEEVARNRQSDQILRKMITIATPETDQVLFLVLPKSDPNGAFSLVNRPDNFDNIQRLAKKYQIQWIRANSLSEVTAAMRKIDKISHLKICGHGEKSAICLGRESITEENLSKASFPNLDPKAHILLCSCATGVKDGIAAKISHLFPLATCFAPEEEVTSPQAFVFFNQQEKPALLQLKQTTNRILTHVFHYGKSIPLQIQTERPNLEQIAEELTNTRPNLAAFLHTAFVD